MTNTGCYISTGQKQVLHTLWTFDSTGSYFVKNLSANKDKAIADAKAFAEYREIPFEGFAGASVKFKRGEGLELFGIHFKHKRKKGKSFYQGYPTQEFWKEWCENKEELKKQGFVVSKWINKYDRDRKEIWYVFYYPMAEQEG